VYIRIDSVFDQRIWARALRQASRSAYLRLMVAGGLLVALGLLLAVDDVTSGLPLIMFGLLFGGVLPLMSMAQAGTRVSTASRQPTTYEFTDATVRSTSSLLRVEASWAVYTGALFGRGFVALRQGTRLFSVIPTSSLAPAQLAELEAFLRNRFPAGVRGKPGAAPPGFEANAGRVPPPQDFTVPPGGAASYIGPIGDRTE
jgi:hypothetical protein